MVKKLEVTAKLLSCQFEAPYCYEIDDNFDHQKVVVLVQKNLITLTFTVPREGLAESKRAHRGTDNITVKAV